MRKLILATTLVAYALTGNARAEEQKPAATYLLAKVTIATNGQTSVEVYDSYLTVADCGERLAAMPEPSKDSDGNIIAWNCMIDMVDMGEE